MNTDTPGPPRIGNGPVHPTSRAVPRDAVARSDTDAARAGLQLVTCVSRTEVLQQRLLSSPCLQPGGLRLAAHWHCGSAAEAFNAAMAGAAGQARWLVWVHQDVVLPAGWETGFWRALQQGLQRWPQLLVAGVYGVAGAGAGAVRAGHVLHRGEPLREAAALPCRVDSLDELLLAVRVDSRLRMDPALGFDFYGTDLVLQAQARGGVAAVLEGYCEHWTDTPGRDVPRRVVERVAQSAEVFERKWRHRLPLATSCFQIGRAGDVRAFLSTVVAP
ncbi:MAG: hypothetical protein FGM55_16435 [Rhodoferax sp.]|nr:hypothetical protein [Rhodoferax sp.]